MATSVGRRSGTLAALIMGVLLWSAPVAEASCAPPLAISDAMEQAPVVFVGTAMKVDHDGRLASFSVDEVWKGDLETQVLVSGGPSLSELEGLGFGESVVTSVDRHYDEGVTYLVVPFAIEEGVYMDNACSVTQVYDASLEDFRPATAHPPVDSGTDSEVVTARIAVGVVVLAAGIAVTVGFMRRRSAQSLSAGSAG